ncbi:hypothetical protein DMJ13_25905 [halophilic archaeon]|nr:hypothetical protein DMJ13_25905 [halophilic archaeon]
MEDYRKGAEVIVDCLVVHQIVVSLFKFSPKGAYCTLWVGREDVQHAVADCLDVGEESGFNDRLLLLLHTIVYN